VSILCKNPSGSFTAQVQQKPSVLEIALIAAGKSILSTQLEDTSAVRVHIKFVLHVFLGEFVVALLTKFCWSRETVCLV
jgi:hypothetical protein